jgi:DNA-binding FadR family transcriptional regulator
MLEPAPGRGTFVRSLNPGRGVLTEFAAEHSWADILAVRRGLEVQAAALAATQRTAEGLARLRAAHALDEPGNAAAECGRSPGQFHATVVELADNRLLTELYAALLGAVRRGISAGEVRHGLDDEQRRDDHTALLAAIAAGNATAAAALAASHADHDLVVAEPR